MSYATKKRLYDAGRNLLASGKFFVALEMVSISRIASSSFRVWFSSSLLVTRLFMYLHISYSYSY